MKAIAAYFIGLAALFALIVMVVAPLLATIASNMAYGHDLAAWSDPVRDQWYRSLRVPYKEGRIPLSCCDRTDAAHISLDRVREVGSTWYVDLGQGFVRVPEDRVVRTPPSIDGEPYLFMMVTPSKDSPNGIRCFIPPVGLY